MTSKTLLVALFAIAAGCASHTRSYSRDEAKPPAAPTRADTLRARSLAAATLNQGIKPSLAEGSGKAYFPIEAAQADEVGSVILAFTVLPNGRVDRDSRTIIYLEGH